MLGSDFGRSLTANSNGGTDHGEKNALFAKLRIISIVMLTISFLLQPGEGTILWQEGM